MSPRPARWAIGLALALLAGLAAAPAHALQVTAFDAQLAQPSGASAVQAGGHPDVSLSFDLSTLPGVNGALVPEENVLDLDLELPPGMLGDPVSMPACASALLAGPYAASCPPETQIGLAISMPAPHRACRCACRSTTSSRARTPRRSSASTHKA